MAFLIPFIAFLEGFTTLSIEIIALRRFTPLIGTSSISTSIILGVILLALSYGYYRGGKNSRAYRGRLAEKVTINLVIASVYYLLFTFSFDTRILDLLLHTTESYFFSILWASLLLFFLPVFLASQTLPLLAEMIDSDNTGEKMGRLLFFSTVGSFLGSVLTSSLFFPLIGVAHTATLNACILSGITIMMIRNRKISPWNIGGIVVFILCIFSLFQKPVFGAGTIYSTANSYHDIRIYDAWIYRIFSQNGAFSSGIDTRLGESFFSYIIELKHRLLEREYKKILIIGAAGFTLPNELAESDHITQIDVVDVDSSLQDIAEEYFLEKTLSPKIHFYPDSARYFLRTSRERYDAIVIDVYIGKSLPAEALTQEFFSDLQSHSDAIFINMITDTSLTSDFSQNLLATLTSVFGSVFLLDVSPSEERHALTNFVITNVSIPGYTEYQKDENGTIYTDDQNSIELDIFLRETSTSQRYSTLT